MLVVFPGGIFSATSLRAASGDLLGTATSPHGASYGSAGDRGFLSGATHHVTSLGPLQVIHQATQCRLLGLSNTFVASLRTEAVVVLL